MLTRDDLQSTKLRQCVLSVISSIEFVATAEKFDVPVTPPIRVEGSKRGKSTKSPKKSARESQTPIVAPNKRKLKLD